MEPLSSEEIRLAIEASLAEDVGPGDVTTLATVPPNAHAAAVIVAREPIVVAGLGFAMQAFRLLSRDIDLVEQCADGESIPPGRSVLNIRGQARAILTAERVALNFLQRLSGVASMTRLFVDAVVGTNAKILDTRKTTPGWRRFEKYAVACGGGQNHRFGLFDMVLIKDNHLVALRDEQPSAIAAAVARARKNYPNLKVEVEADNLDQARQALDAGADIILLDNMPLENLRVAVNLVRGAAKLEASGGVNLNTVRSIAETGVDFISVGAITHSARAVDLGLDFK